MVPLDSLLPSARQKDAARRMDALSTGLREIRWEGFEISFAYDIDERLIPVLLHLHGPHTKLHVGRRRGDLLACNVDELPRSRGFSHQWAPHVHHGVRLGPAEHEDDPCERVFRQVTKLIISQGRKRCLGFSVEMVLGIAHRSREQSYYKGGFLRPAWFSFCTPLVVYGNLCSSIWVESCGACTYLLACHTSPMQLLVA